MPAYNKFNFLMGLVVLSALSGNLHALQLGHFHHVHMNVSDVEHTREFYQRIFGVVPINYNDTKPALLAERSFFLLNPVENSSLKNHLLTGLIHVGWSGVDGNSEYQWLQEQGIKFYTPLSKLTEDSTYMYFYGPDNEVIEIYDLERHHRFNHIHMLADEPKATALWFDTLVNPDKELTSGALGNENVNMDNVSITIFPMQDRFIPKENTGPLQITDGTHLDHIAFSFRDLDAAHQRIKDLGIEIIRSMDTDAEYGFRHFFVRAPNGVLVELVEANPWPESAWD